jgi:hypothetical protein
MKKAHELVHHRYCRITRLSPRDGFNGLFRALLGDRAFLPPSLNELIRKLDASVEASGPHDFTVHRWRVVSEPSASIASRAQRP